MEERLDNATRTSCYRNLLARPCISHVGRARLARQLQHVSLLARDLPTRLAGTTGKSAGRAQRRRRGEQVPASKLIVTSLR